MSIDIYADKHIIRNRAWVVRSTQETGEMGQVAETLRNKIEASHSVYEVAKHSGVSAAQIYRFMNDGKDLRLSTIERLCKYFKLELRPTRKSARK